MDRYIKAIKTYLAPTYDIISKLPNYNPNNPANVVSIPGTLEKYLKRPIDDATIEYVEEEYNYCVNRFTENKIIVKFGFDDVSIFINYGKVFMFHFVNNILHITHIVNGKMLSSNTISEDEEFRLVLWSLKVARHVLFLLEETYAIDLSEHLNENIITNNIKETLLRYWC